MNATQNATQTREGLHFFGWATNERGEFEQILTTFPNDKMSCAWTGVVYGRGRKGWNAASDDVEHLNIAIADSRYGNVR